LLVASILAVGTACVSAPEIRQVDLDVQVPDRWTAADGPPTGDVSTEWWRTFDDPVLTRLVEVALERNHDLHAAAARLDRAVAEARIAGADLKPSVGVGLGASRARQNFIGLPIPGAPDDVLSSTTTQFGASFDASWEVDLWGRVRAGARAAVAEAEASRSDLRAARLSIAGQTAKIWFSILEARQQLNLATDSAASFRRSAEQVRTRYESGTRSCSASTPAAISSRDTGPSAFRRLPTRCPSACPPTSSRGAPTCPRPSAASRPPISAISSRAARSTLA
jgi:outer membrane protein TolC